VNNIPLPDTDNVKGTTQKRDNGAYYLVLHNGNYNEYKLKRDVVAAINEAGKDNVALVIKGKRQKIMTQTREITTLG
jgi:hypothetical protein